MNRFLMTLLAVVALLRAGLPLCAGEPTNNLPAPNLAVTLDTSAVVNVHDWAKRAAALTEEWYPRIHQILGIPLPANPPPVKLVFKEMSGVAATSGNRITVSAGWVRAHPEDIGCVVHELVHVVQAYPSAEPAWLTEGIADYVRFWHFEKIPQTRINKATATPRDSYRTTGAFLAWVEKEHPGTIQRLNSAMRESRYRDALFQEATGQSLDALWREFIAQWKDS